MEQYTHVQSNALVYRLVKSLFISIVIGLIVGGFFALTGMKYAVLIFTIITFLVQLIPSYLEYQNLGYELESNSVNLRKGLLSMQNLTIPFARITNASFNQSFFQRFFSVGDLNIDQEDSSFKWQVVDSITANKISHEIASKSNIQQVTKTK